MAMNRSALLDRLEALKAAGVDERMRMAAQGMYQALIDAEADGVIGAGPWERSEGRTAVRDGSSPRVLSTTSGDLGAADPEVADGVVLPEPARAPAADRPGAVRGGHEGQPQRREHQEGR